MAEQMDNTANDTTTSRSRITEKLLSRANTMLKAATLSRETTRAGAAKIKETVKTLQREKTKLVINEKQQGKDEEDEEMQQFLKKLQQNKVQTFEFRDSDFDTDLEDNFPIVQKHSSDQLKPTQLYLKTCKKLGLRPVPFVENSIETKEVKVLNRCLNALDVLAITNALISNPFVMKFTLNGNNIGNEGAQLVAMLLKDRETSLEKLSISNNNIEGEGLAAIADMLEENRQITSLNLSGNRIDDDSVKLLAIALKENRFLQYLNISYIGIGDKGAKYLASAIAHNEGLAHLDLSWNKIRPSGGCAIAQALKENVMVKSLNLSMNGLSSDGALILGETLLTNDSLTYLDLTFNRIFDEGAAHIAKGLEKNENLHNLIMHHNPITSAGAMTLLSAIRSNENTAMWKLDLNSVPIVKDVAAAYEEYHSKNEDFQFLYGVLLDTEPRLEGDMIALSHRNPMAMVRDYIEIEGLRLMDFFRLMDKDHGGTISREEFVEGLQQANVPMTQTQLDELIEILDKDGDGEIDYRELVEGDREYRRRRLKKRMKAMEAMKQVLLNPQPEESWML